MSIFVSFVDVVQSYNDYARIGYQSILPTATLSGTAGASGYPISAVTNPATYERYKPISMPATIQADAGAAVAVDYIGIAAHNLGSLACTAYVESSNDASAWTTRLTLTPTTDTTMFGMFDSVSARYWRVRITGDTAPTVGVVFLGAMLTMQRTIYGGHSPITLSRVTAVRPVVSETGQWLGSSETRRGFSTSFAWKNLTAAWYREKFDPFVATNPRARPFFIAWRPYSFPDEVGYCWATGDISPSNQGTKDLMSVDMKVEGFSDRS